MNIFALEQAVKESVNEGHQQTIMESVSSYLSESKALTSEFTQAIETLSPRLSNISSASIFDDIWAGWH